MHHWFETHPCFGVNLGCSNAHLKEVGVIVRLRAGGESRLQRAVSGIYQKLHCVKPCSVVCQTDDKGVERTYRFCPSTPEESVHGASHGLQERAVAASGETRPVCSVASLLNYYFEFGDLTSLDSLGSDYEDDFARMFDYFEEPFLFGHESCW